MAKRAVQFRGGGKRHGLVHGQVDRPQFAHRLGPGRRPAPPDFHPLGQRVPDRLWLLAGLLDHARILDSAEAIQKIRLAAPNWTPIAVIAILASANALAHSYAGLYDWAVHHRLTGWQAKSWPAEIDVFLAVGELALYVAYLDAWPARQRIWPWATALTGLAVSVAGNIGHIQAHPGHPVILADRLTAATSPLAAFAGLSVGLLVLKMTRQHAAARPGRTGAPTAPVMVPSPGPAVLRIEPTYVTSSPECR